MQINEMETEIDDGNGNRRILQNQKKEPKIFQNNIKSKTCKLESNETHQIAGHDLEQIPQCAIGFVPALKIVVPLHHRGV